MRSNLLLITLVLCTASCVRAQAARLLAVDLEKSWEKDHRWVEHNEVDGRFSLLAPAEFTHSLDSVTTAVGVQAYHTFHLQAPDQKRAENVIYALSYVDFPQGSLHHDSLELVTEFLLGTEEEAVRAVGGETVYAADKQLFGYPARQWRIDYPSRGGTASARTLAIVANNRYYELKVFSRSDKGVNKSADKFFDSLRIFAPDGEQ
ncbi:MAG: hypothetical protein AAF597_05300 [Bacteroidota bacterium]